MKKGILGVSIVIVFSLGFMLWQKTEEKKLLLLHQPIPLNQVDAIHTWVKGTHIKRVPTEEYMKVVEWFNDYPPERIKEEKIPLSEAQVVIDLLYPTRTIILNYVDEKIYVGKSGDNVSPYVFLDDSPELENFFKELIKQ